MQAIPAEPLVAGGSFTIDLQTLANNPLSGAVLQNLSGFTLTISSGGSQWVLPPGMNDVVSLVGITGGKLIVQVGTTNAAPTVPNPVFQGTVYEANDTLPTGSYPMVNPGFTQALPPTSAIASGVIGFSTSSPGFLGAVPVAGAYVVNLTEQAQEASDEYIVSIQWELTPGGPAVGQTYYWCRGATTSNLPRTISLVPLAPYMNISFTTAAAGTIHASYAVDTINEVAGVFDAQLPFTVLSAQSQAVGASSTVPILPNQYREPGRYCLWIEANQTATFRLRSTQPSGGSGAVANTILQQWTLGTGGEFPTGEATIDVTLPPDDWWLDMINTSTSGGVFNASITGPTR